MAAAANQLDKNEQFLLFILKHHGPSSVTSLMKIAYLIDLVNMERKGEQLSEFSYKRYYYGPFDSRIYLLIERLVRTGYLKAEQEFTQFAEYTMYSVVDGVRFPIDLLPTDKKSIQIVLSTVRGYGPRVLTEMAYRTQPMKALNATLGGNENLNKPLNLFLVNATSSKARRKLNS